MSLQFVYAPELNYRAVMICQEYWSFANRGGYLKYVDYLCTKHNITSPQLFHMLTGCRAYLQDVRCHACNRPRLVTVPADIPYYRSHQPWVCDECHAFTTPNSHEKAQR